MQLVLPPDIEAFVQRQVDSGKYRSPVELAIAAIQMLQKQEEDEDIYEGQLEELQKDAQVGLDDLASGRVVDGPTAINEILDKINRQRETSGS